MRNFEKIITKKKRRGYDEHVELVKKQRKKRNEDKKRGKNLMRFFAMEIINHETRHYHP